MNRLLGLMSDNTPSGAHGPQLILFTRFLFLHLTTRLLLRSIRDPEPRLLFFASAFIVLFGFVLNAGARPIVKFSALVLLTAECVALFPNNSNHFFLEFLCLFFVWLFDSEKPVEGEMLLHALRWLLVIALFWSGIHKILFGTYFTGAFLAYQVAETENFALVFKHILPAAEFHRIRALHEPGPYAFESPVALVVANCAYLGELASAALMCLKPFRRIGAVVVLLLVFGIELAAREFMFGVFTVALTLLFVDGRWMQRFYTLAMFAYVYLVLASLHLAPSFWFN